MLSHRALSRVLGAVFTIVLAAPSSVAAETPPLPGRPSVERGLDIANRWCATCHLVAPAQTTAPSDYAPSFAALAAKMPEAEPRYRAFLTKPHTPMRELFLTRAEVDDLMAYLAATAAR